LSSHFITWFNCSFKSGPLSSHKIIFFNTSFRNGISATKQITFNTSFRNGISATKQTSFNTSFKSLLSSHFTTWFNTSFRNVALSSHKTIFFNTSFKSIPSSHFTTWFNDSFKSLVSSHHIPWFNTSFKNQLSSHFTTWFNCSFKNGVPQHCIWFNCSFGNAEYLNYNKNLTVYNPNPGNGTHNTNYIKPYSPGLTTSVDVTNRNFTNPPAAIPGSYSIVVNGTPPSNVPAIWNTSAVYNNVWAETSGIITPGALPYVGQVAQPNYEIFRSFLRFDTGVIPDNAVITSAYVSLVVWSDYSTTDYKVILQECKSPVPHNPLIRADYWKAGFAGNDGFRNSSHAVNGSYFNITLNLTGRTYINKTGGTNFSLRSDQDINGHAPTKNEFTIFYGYGLPATYYPRLIINYTVPTSNWDHIVNITWFDNSTGPWLQYATSQVNQNETVTVTNPNFDNVATYWWYVHYESNNTYGGTSQIWTFTTVPFGGGGGTGKISGTASGYDDYTWLLVVGLLLGIVLGPMIFEEYKKRRM